MTASEPDNAADDARNARWLDTALQEYRSIREESLAALQSHLTTLRYGLAGVVVLIGFALRYDKSYIGWLLALIIVPIVVLFVAIMWMGEYARMARAGYFLALFEDRINKPFLRAKEDPPLEWEHWLREKGPDRSRQASSRHRYLFIFLIFVAMEGVTIAIGVYDLPNGHSPSHGTTANSWTPVLVGANIVVLVTLAAYFRSSYDRLRGFATLPELIGSPVRKRLRVRIWLIVALGLVAVVSVPLPIWGLCVFLWVVLPSDVFYLSLVPAALWAVAIPLVAPESVVRPLLETWLMKTRAPSKREKAAVKKALNRGSDQPPGSASGPGILPAGGSVLMLRKDEIQNLHVVDSTLPNASAVCRDGVTVTSWACESPERLRPLLAHELAHHRLGHLRMLALMHVYLWPYRYYSVRLPLFGERSWSEKVSEQLHSIVLLVFRVLSLTGWATWCMVRISGRVAQRDADRYVRSCNLGEALHATLDGLLPEPADDWFGLPVPTEHAAPAKRIERGEKALEREVGWLYPSRNFRTSQGVSPGQAGPVARS
jgi:Zn-dependent protease with chaperone function